MSVFESSAAYNNAALPTIWLDETTGLYLGEVMSRSGMLRTFGSSERQVEFDLNNQIYWEDHARLRALELEEQARSVSVAEVATSVGLAGVEAVSHTTSYTPHTIGALSKPANAAFEYGVMAPVALAGKSTGKITKKAKGKGKKEGFLGAFSKDGVESLFVATVGGVTIKAASRKLLKKQLIRERNSHVQKVMLNVKVHEKELDKTRNTQERTSDLRERLRSKKAAAEDLGAGLWTERMGARGKNKSWEERLETMRERIGAKKEYALAAAL